MKKRNLMPLLVCLFITSIKGFSQNTSTLFENYVKKYSDIAVDEMVKYKIPASITLAQGLLESGAGQSRLATEANNHFGIKCGGDWTGPSITHTDDKRNECFRKYSNPKTSYEDHSKFLLGRPWYSNLFKLKITDYVGWAYGLKEAGYATDEKYPEKLIAIIEQYGLSKYDKYDKAQGSSPTVTPPVTPVKSHQRYATNDVLFIIVREGDTFESLREEFGLKKKKILKYNDLPKNYILQPNDIIYLEKKKKKAAKSNKIHVATYNESLHDISQRYAIRLKKLYKKNKKHLETNGLRVGDTIKLR
ncbi:glycoside hydrolase family 73 protein [Bacteroides sp. 519]|uniref:glycoside hydrolase family 73 protein n=1 Tax=Bacteroides sp. 519 TaxID=2302937 RepID=UPI0013D73BE0|nr:glucosaminidase domain-containing protein [Bacteroides sp. 519]NDV58295.1 LysM peptidoglycan-binding domain-containing protein [Bacteroides sp. 519]